MTYMVSTTVAVVVVGPTTAFGVAADEPAAEPAALLGTAALEPAAEATAGAALLAAVPAAVLAPVPSHSPLMLNINQEIQQGFSLIRKRPYVSLAPPCGSMSHVGVNV